MKLREVLDKFGNGGFNIVDIDAQEDLYISYEYYFENPNQIERYLDYKVHRIWMDEKYPLIARVEITNKGE